VIACPNRLLGLPVGASAGSGLLPVTPSSVSGLRVTIWPSAGSGLLSIASGTVSSLRVTIWPGSSSGLSSK
jgi:hypothetical protein